MFDEVFSQALQAVIRDFDSDQIRLESEEDLRGFLFHRCVEGLSKRRHATPVPIHAEVRMGQQWADLAIGPESQTLVELKLEPFTTSLGIVTEEAIKDDVNKLHAYSRLGHTGHFVMIECEGVGPADDDWWWPRRTPKVGIPERGWHESVRGKFAWVHHIVPLPRPRQLREAGVLKTQRVPLRLCRRMPPI